MSELNKGISIIIMILSVMVFVIIGFFVYWEFFSSVEKKENINFSNEGNIMINNPGFIENTWYLSYKISGTSANSAKLSFDKDSICRNESNSCSELISGEKVEIRGIDNGEEVLVKELKIVD